MNHYFVVAGCLALALGFAHSIFGELLIFRRIHRRDRGSEATGAALGRQHGRILRATWHIATVFGWGLAAVLWWLAADDGSRRPVAFVQYAVALSFLGAALLTLFGTKGRHPGWVVLVGIALLVWLG